MVKHCTVNTTISSSNLDESVCMYILCLIFIFLFMFELFNGLAATVASGILPPIQCILWLIILFITTGIILFQDGAETIGILYVLIYVGAIAILFLFIVSLIDTDEIEDDNDVDSSNEASPWLWVLLTIIIVPFINIEERVFIESEQHITTMFNELEIIGTVLYTEYALLLIIIGIILILSVIGAIAITK